MYRQLRQWNEIYITIHIWVTIRVSRSSIITDVIETQAASAIAELHLERRWGYAWRPFVGTLKFECNSKTVSSVRVTLTLSSATDDLGHQSACTCCQKLHPPSPFIIITHPESWYSFYRPTEGGRLSRPSWLVTYRDGLPVHRRSPIRVLTGSDVAQLRWSRPTRYH